MCQILRNANSYGKNLRDLSVPASQCLSRHSSLSLPPTTRHSPPFESPRPASLPPPPTPVSRCAFVFSRPPPPTPVSRCAFVFSRPPPPVTRHPFVPTRHSPTFESAFLSAPASFAATIRHPLLFRFSRHPPPTTRHSPPFESAFLPAPSSLAAPATHHPPLATLAVMTINPIREFRHRGVRDSSSTDPPPRTPTGFPRTPEE
jgi:hypothetical protein